MAIGKPLLVKERKGVSQPVLSAQTQQLSSNVPTQKIAMADYSIGMNNASSSFAVTNELVKMVDAGVKAKVYIDQTKQQYARLNLMENWNKTDNIFKTEFAKAITPEEQQEVIDNFAVSMQTRTDNYRKGGGLGLPTSDSLQSQRDLSSLRSSSQNLFSKMSTTMAANINNRTNTMLDTKNKGIIRDAITNKTADPISALNDLKSNYEAQVKVGGLLPEQAIWNLNVATDKIISGRASLFAVDLAKQIVDSNSAAPPDASQLKEHIEGVMNMQLNDRQHRLLEDTFNDTYYKELAAFNAQETAELKMGMLQSKKLRANFEATKLKATVDGKLSEEESNNLIEQAKAIDVFVPGYSTKKIVELENFRFGEADVLTVESFTTGEQSQSTIAKLDPESDGYYSDEKLAELQTSLKSMGNTDKTIVGILGYYRKQNQERDKDLTKSAPIHLANVITDNITAGTPVGELMKEENYFEIGAQGVGQVGWDKVIQKGRWGAIYNQTLQELDIMQRNKQGVFSKENENLDPVDRLKKFKSDAERLFQKNLDIEMGKINKKEEMSKERRAFGSKQDFDDLKGKRLEAQAKREERRNNEKFVQEPRRYDLPKRKAQLLIDKRELENEFTKAELTGEYGTFLFDYLPALNKQLHEATGIADKQRTQENREKSDKLYSDIKQSYSDLFFTSYMGVAGIPSYAPIVLSGSKISQVPQLLAQKLRNYALGGLASVVAEKIQKGQEPLPEEEIEETTEYRNPREGMTTKNLEGDTVTQEEFADTNRAKIESGMMGVDSGYVPVDTGRYMPTGKGQYAPQDFSRELNRDAQYTVQPNDTMSQIAQKFNIDLNELAEANPAITDISKIFAGQDINLPTSESVTAATPTEIFDSGETAVSVPSEVTTNLQSKIKNNPGNVEVGQGYAGETGKTYANGKFAVFDTPQMGARAMFVDMRSKMDQFNGNLLKMITKYAPPKNKAGKVINNTQAYYEHLKDMVGGKEVIAEKDLANVIKGMISHENTKEIADYYLNDPTILEEASQLSTMNLPTETTYEEAKAKFKQQNFSSTRTIREGLLEFRDAFRMNKDTEKELKPIVEKGNILDKIAKAPRNILTEAIPDNLRFFASYLKDNYGSVKGKGKDKPIVTEDALSKGVQSVLRQAVMNAQADGRNEVTYKDYPDSSFGLSIPAIVAASGGKNKDEYAEANARYPKGWKRKARLLMDSTDDAVAAATTIGAFKFIIENGEIILTDVYDFSKYAGKKKSAYSEIRKSVETAKGDVVYNIRANLGKIV